jgi:hypothetical protein
VFTSVTTCDPPDSSRLSFFGYHSRESSLRGALTISHSESECPSDVLLNRSRAVMLPPFPLDNESSETVRRSRSPRRRMHTLFSWTERTKEPRRGFALRDILPCWPLLGGRTSRCTLERDFFNLNSSRSISSSDSCCSWSRIQPRLSERLGDLATAIRTETLRARSDWGADSDGMLNSSFYSFCAHLLPYTRASDTYSLHRPSCALGSRTYVTLEKNALPANMSFPSISAI